MFAEKLPVDLSTQISIQAFINMGYTEFVTTEPCEVRMALMDLMIQISVHSSNISETFDEICGGSKFKWKL